MSWHAGFPPFLFTLSGLLILAGLVLALPAPRLRRVSLLPIAAGTGLLLVLALIRQRFWPGLVPSAAATVLLFALGLVRTLSRRGPGPRRGRPLVLLPILLALLPAWLASPPALEPGPPLYLSELSVPGVGGTGGTLPLLRPLPTPEGPRAWVRFLVPQDGRETLPALGLSAADIRRETGLPGWLVGHLSTPSGRLRPADAGAGVSPGSALLADAGTVVMVLPAGHPWQGYRSIAADLVASGRTVVFLPDAGAEIAGLDGLLLPNWSALPQRLVAEIGLAPTADNLARARESLVAESASEEAVTGLSSSAVTITGEFLERLAPPFSVVGLGEGALHASLVAPGLQARELVLIDPAAVLALPQDARRAALGGSRVSVFYPAAHAVGSGLLGSLPNPGISAVLLGGRPGALAVSEPLVLPAPWERLFGRDPRIGSVADRQLLHHAILAALGIPGADLDDWLGSELLLESAD